MNLLETGDFVGADPKRMTLAPTPAGKRNGTNDTEGIAGIKWHNRAGGSEYSPVWTISPREASVKPNISRPELLRFPAKLHGTVSVYE